MNNSKLCYKIVMRNGRINAEWLDTDLWTAKWIFVSFVKDLRMEIGAVIC